MRLLFLLAGLVSAASAQTGDNVLLVVNRTDPGSLQIGDYYRSKRAVPAENVCSLEMSHDEEITWDMYLEGIERPVSVCLAGKADQILYIATTRGVPLKIRGLGVGLTTEQASVDSELTLLYGKLKGVQYQRAGTVDNPFFGKGDAPFRHPEFPIFLVTRLAGSDVEDVKAMIDRGLVARNRGKFVIDMRGNGEEADNWLRAAASMLPANRVVLETTAKMLDLQKDVIGYASWGSNDPARKVRWLGYAWLPGAIVTDFVSTNGRTQMLPPNDWTLQAGFGGSRQSLSSDYVREGASGASGNVYEPFLTGTVRPDYLLPAYFRGRNLAESYYLAMPFLSWQGIVLGDPLCALAKP